MSLAYSDTLFLKEVMLRGSGPRRVHSTKPFQNVKTVLFYLKQQRLLHAQLKREKQNLPVLRNTFWEDSRHRTPGQFPQELNEGREQIYFLGK